MSFRGNHPARIDEKGRLKVPADFKRVLDERYGAEYYITSRDGKVGKVYPLDEWIKVEQILTTNPSDEARKFQRLTSFWGQVVEIDAQGRLLLPGHLREAAKLTAEVAVVGVMNHLEVWVFEDYRKLIEENPITPDDDKALANIGIW